MVWDHEVNWQCDECGEHYTFAVSRIGKTICLICDQCGNTIDIKELGASE